METVLHNSTWSIEKHTVCPPAYLQLLAATEETAGFASCVASAPPLSQSLEAASLCDHHMPLPPGWEVLADSSGRPYYGNPALRITQYQHPGMQLAHSSSPSVLQAQRPPVHQQFQRDAARMSTGSSQIELQEISFTAQWQHCTDAYGRRYVINTMTGETKWEYGN
jgi:hypothetical protein